MGLLNAVQPRELGDGGGGWPMVQWPFRAAGINASYPTASALASPQSLLLANAPQAGTSGTNSPLHAFGEERVQNFHVATHFEIARSGLVDVKRRAVGIRVSAKEMRGTLNSACNSFVPVSENRAFVRDIKCADIQSIRNI